jgi:hypothetical protein
VSVSHLTLLFQLIQHSKIHRSTQKAKEAEPTRSRSKDKGKTSVVEDAHEELWKEALARLLAKKAAIQEMIDRLQ